MADNNTRLVVTARGMPSYKKKLEKLGKDLEKLDEPMERAGRIGLAAVQSYPPYTNSWRTGVPSFTPFRPGSRYERQRVLQGGWRGRLTKGSKIVVRYSITNNTVGYMKYVQGNQQSSIHSPWWIQVDEWTEPVNKEATKIFREFMNKITKGI